MNSNLIYKIIFLLAAAFLINSCVEPYDFETETFEDALVVEAILTDEVKFHEVKLTRTYRLEEDFPKPESNANVVVTDDTGNEFPFYETTPGNYVSNTAFGAQPQNKYQLLINTIDGNAYSSEPAELLPGNEIDDLYAKRMILQGDDGVALLVDSENSEAASKYALYEYEETYKIVSPYVVRSTIEFEGENWRVVPNTRNETICYNTVPSKEILLSNTTSLRENNLDSYLVRFIQKDDPVLGQRYSILVKRYSLTREAHSYYSTLKKISGSESLLSQNQPGFVNGNMYSLNDEDEKVLGFFTLSNISTKRIYFNYYDFFEFDEPRPQFPESCIPFRPGENFDTPIGMIQGGTVRYLSMAGPPVEGEIGEGPIRVIATECVDCTVYGTNEVPEFWEE
ncbi:DUF4249 domain-containing protein [Salinimicrobium sp. TH3]|uniref:DUF4249 domain-containing protein n=1 Tax=Salinimicrobium sp. TH3 TaxID=2997342 RepID=UPI0022756969|nr:DUF4249 domain-containing protein [Salinimicrobium sp. TH3]MCY2688327.1 DUF4249 domain-containing protein [Salinimicrobium sp. TH3]